MSVQTFLLCLFSHMNWSAALRKSKKEYYDKEDSLVLRNSFISYRKHVLESEYII